MRLNPNLKIVFSDNKKQRDELLRILTVAKKMTDNELKKSIVGHIREKLQELKCNKKLIINDRGLVVEQEFTNIRYGYNNLLEKLSDQRKFRQAIIRKRNVIKEDLIIKFKRRLQTSKGPKTKHFHFGVEVEFYIKKNQYDNLLILLNKYSDFVQLKSDGSLRPNNDELGIEVAIVHKDIKMIKKVIETIKNLEPRTDRKCGIHVHVDCRKLNNEQRITLYDNFVKIQNALFKLTLEERKSSYFCKKNTKRDTFTQHDRYKAINSTALIRFSTIEVRLFHSHFDSKLLENWLNVLKSIYKQIKPIEKRILSLKRLTNVYKFDKKTERYLNAA